MFPEAKTKPKKLLPLDEWILHEINDIAAYTRKQYERYDFNGPVTKLKNFMWEAFASHYIELVKHRAYNQEKKFTKDEQTSALYTLHHCLDLLLKMMAPVVPFISYRIFKDLRGKDIHFEQFPEPEKIPKPKFSTSELMKLNGVIWKKKKDGGLSLKAEVKSATLPEKFRLVEKDLALTHSIREIKWGKKVAVSL